MVKTLPGKESQGSIRIYFGTSFGDLAKKSKWAFKLKMSFNHDPSKPAPELFIGRKLKTVPHPSITFNNNPLSLCLSQKHLGLVLDSKLNFNEHIKHFLSKVNKSIGLLCKFQPVLPRSSLLTIYNTFIRSHFDYADVVYDQSYKSSFHKKIESIQCCFGSNRCYKRIFF